MITISVNDDQLIIKGSGAYNTGINAIRPFHNFVNISECQFSVEAIASLSKATDNKKSHANVGTYEENGKLYFFWRGEQEQSLNINYLRQLAGTDWSLIQAA